jgi:very-short-patch-repair endonuclease
VDQSSLRQKSKRPELLSEVTRQEPKRDAHGISDQPETISTVLRLEDYPEVQKAWAHYVDERWLPWSEDHDSWEQVHKIYAALFAMRQEQLRNAEELELVVGVGLLTWDTPGGQRLQRHLLVADAVLEFEAQLAKFNIRPHTEGAKLRLELDMLDTEEQPTRAEDATREALSAADEDPWDRAHVEQALKSLVHLIDAKGKYDGTIEKTRTGGTFPNMPLVEFAPAVILRKRSQRGLTDALSRIGHQLEAGGLIPPGFRKIAEIPPNDPPEPNDLPPSTAATTDCEVFFPKHANEEQRQIVTKLRSANGLLVQGPPGTGKSHTIANLICHLLATGQRTLITAKTPRALKVLKGLIPAELQPLCIDLLGVGPEERRALESSVGGILRRMDEWNQLFERNDDERIDLERRRDQLREEQVQISRRLRQIREAETYSTVIAQGKYRGTAARIAEAMNRDSAKYDWFTDSVSQDAPCAVNVDHLGALLADLRYCTPKKRKELKLAIPEVALTSERFAALVDEETRAIEEAAGAAEAREVDVQTADLLGTCSLSQIEWLHDALRRYFETVRPLSSLSHPWMNEALRDVLGGNSSVWHELLRVTGDAIAAIEDLVDVADDTQVQFPATIDVRTLHADVCQLRTHLEKGGKLRRWVLFTPADVKPLRYVIKSVRMNGRRISTAAEFERVANALQVRTSCDNAWGFWAGRCDRAPGPYKAQLLALKSLRDGVARILAIEGLLSTCRDAMSHCPNLSEPAWADTAKVERLATSCRLALARQREQAAMEQFEEVARAISLVSARDDAHPVTRTLLAAIRHRDRENFADCLRQMQLFRSDCDRLQRMNDHLSQLRKSLPQFASLLEQTCRESYWEERIQNFENAWHWAQARSWVEDYIRLDDAHALSERAKQLEDAILDLTAKLAALRAWSYCFQRLTDEHRKHMEAWQLSMRLLGKGTGKHAQRHRRDAQKHLDACREAVPAWVMPLHRVWDTVDPKPGMFDVIIVDEASQCGIEALPLFYLAKKVLIVGDDKQISPEAVGLALQDVHRVVEEFLFDFQFKSAFDLQSSLFDHGKLWYGTRQITLREHFRCMPEIIRFSNDLCYSATPLIPLRQYGTERLPPLQHAFVSGGFREGEGNRVINKPEAEAIVSKIAEMCADSRYAGKSMGVVVLQGDAQAGLVEAQLLARIGAEEIEKRQLVCGNPYSFQGDERDIMFLSLVAATNERIGPLTKPADERRFNVAASRARDAMILFHSVKREDLSNTCLRRKLLEFFEDTVPPRVDGVDWGELGHQALRGNRSVVGPPSPFESWFELDVALQIARKGYDVRSQFEVASKRIDLVVEGGQARLGIECDGDHWHGADRFEADMERQRQLERCGWVLFRVRESAFYANTHKALDGLWHLLKQRQIVPRAVLHEKTDAVSATQHPGV